jgi:hypothetical protein
MATKTWTTDANFCESKGDFDGIMINNNELILHLKTEWQSKTWLGATDEIDEWIGDAAVYVVRGYWRVIFDSALAGCGWGFLSWTANEPGSSNVKFRARSAATEAALAGATWTAFYETTPVDNAAGDNRWFELEAVLEEGSTPDLEDITQAYGEGC